MDGSSRIAAKSVVRTPSRANDPEPEPRRALDVLRVLDEQPVDRGTDRSVAEEADPGLDG